MLRHLRRNSIAFRATAGVLLVSYLSACTGYHTEEATPREVVTTKHPDRVRITRQDGSQIELLQPAIEADSVIGRNAAVADSLSRIPGVMGQMPTEATPDSLKPRVAVALADIQKVEVEQMDAIKTVVLVGAVGLLIVVAAAAVKEASEPNILSDGQNSCPVVYAWNGHDWQLQSGTFAGAVAEGVARTDVTAMPAAATSDGELRLQVRNELVETDYLDAISVLAVDHPSGVSIAPDAKGRVHAVGAQEHAREARDFSGREIASLLAAADGRSWESAVQARDTAAPSSLVDGIELVFTRPSGVQTAQLVVDARNTSWVPFMLERTLSHHSRAARAWYDSLRTNSKAAEEYRAAIIREAGLRVSIQKGGAWVPQGVVVDPGPEITRRQVVAVDLTGVEGSEVRVRLESTPSFWMIDHVAMSYDVEPPLAVQELSPATALTAEGKDVLSLVATGDNRAWGFEPGEQAELHFPVPALSAGMERTYLVKTTGWYTIHVPDTGVEDYASLQRIIREPGAVAKLSTTTLNEGLRVASTPR
ncbi:MAG TPA: hypothetical protein VMJ30_00955 [Gemmatimonadales bacterium]|nr:hypothetical protein [Gemmatimonadales bacterium]